MILGTLLVNYEIIFMPRQYVSQVMTKTLVI